MISPKNMFSEKKGFPKKKISHKNTCFHQKKIDQIGLKINKVKKGRSWF